MQREVRVRHDERETRGSESLSAPPVLVAPTKHKKAIEEIVSPPESIFNNSSFSIKKWNIETILAHSFIYCIRTPP